MLNCYKNLLCSYSFVAGIKQLYHNTVNKKNTPWGVFLLNLVAGNGFRLAAPALHWRKSPFVKTSGDRHTAVCRLLVVNHFLRGSNPTQHTFNKKYTAWVYFLLNLVAGVGFEPTTFRL